MPDLAPHAFALADLALANVAAGALALALNTYILFGGADFGGGVWDLLASGPRKARQRALISEAISPIWEANHVWLVLAVVLIFTCFPPVFARLGTVLHIPLTLMLVGIVLRGSAFTFRSYDTEHDARQRYWGRIFAGASLLTPVLLGVSVGAIASERVRMIRSSDFVTQYVSPWLTPFALSVGLLVLVLFAFTAAVFLTLESDDPDLSEDFRRRALAAGVALLFAAALSLALSRGHAPLVRRGLIGSGWALPLHLATGVTALAVLAALRVRRYRLARIGVGLQVSLIFWGWVAAQFPYLVPPDLTIARTASPPATLRLVLVALGAGGLLLAPSFIYLFRIFKSAPADPAARLPRGGAA